MDDALKSDYDTGHIVTSTVDDVELKRIAAIARRIWWK